MANNIPLYLFAKAPIAGQAKTRMNPPLSAAQAGALAEQFLIQSVDKVASHWPGETILAVAPDASHPTFQALKQQYPIRLQQQTNGDLGQRLGHCLSKGITHAGAAVVMGCDVPHFDIAILKQVYDQLTMGHNIIGPALDGGFYLLALTSFDIKIFADIDWGSASVLDTMTDNMQQLMLNHIEITALQDIDHYHDLRTLAGLEPKWREFLVPQNNHTA